MRQTSKPATLPAKQPSTGLAVLDAIRQQYAGVAIPEHFAIPPDPTTASLPRFDAYDGTVRLSKTDVIQVGDADGVQLVIAAISPTPWRSKFDRKYDPDAPGQIVCWSSNGATPDPSSAQVQNASCRTCPFAGAVDLGCSFKRRAVVYIDDPNFTGLAVWDINYTTLARPVSITSDKRYAGAQWMNGNDLLAAFSRAGVPLATALVQVARDLRAPAQYKNKVVFLPVGPAPTTLLESISAEDVAAYLDVTVSAQIGDAIDAAPEPAAQEPAGRARAGAATTPRPAARSAATPHGSGTAAALGRAQAALGHTQAAKPRGFQGAGSANEAVDAAVDEAVDIPQDELDAAVDGGEAAAPPARPAPRGRPAPAARPSGGFAGRFGGGRASDL